MIVDILEILVLASLVIITSHIIYRMIGTNHDGPIPLIKPRLKRRPRIVKMTNEKEAAIEEERNKQKGWE